MLAKLKKLLSGCHILKKDILVNALLDSSEAYLIQRALEEMKIANITPDDSFENKDARLRTVIQLINLARYKAQCSRSPQSTRAATAPKD